MFVGRRVLAGASVLRLRKRPSPRGMDIGDSELPVIAAMPTPDSSPLLDIAVLARPVSVTVFRLGQ